MDRPAVDRVDGVPPAIAIDQTNPVRSSRSTVGTMTELNDHLKLLFARAAQLFDRQTALPVRHDTPETIYAELMARAASPGDDPRLVITFPVELPADTTAEQIEQWLAASGFTRVQAEREADGHARCSTSSPTASAIGGREGARDRGHRAGAQARQRPAQRLPAGRRPTRAARREPSCGATRPACTAPRATCATPIRSRRCSRSTRPSAPARPAAASAA